MTMYVRTTVPMALTISSQDYDNDVVLDGNHPYAVLPLWAAQKPEFQALWADNKVEVATDSDFNDIITEIPASELPGGGGIDPNAYVPRDEGGRVPINLMHTQLPLDDVMATNGGQSVLRFLGVGNNAVNHLYVSNANSGQGVNVGIIGDDANINLNLYAQGGGKVTVGDQPVCTSMQPINNVQFGPNYGFQWSDAGSLVLVDTDTAVTLIAPPTYAVGFPVGTWIDIVRAGVGTLTVSGGDGVTIFGTGTSLSARFARARLQKVGEEAWLLTGSLSA